MVFKVSTKRFIIDIPFFFFSPLSYRISLVPIEFMDALTAPRAFKNNESMAQNKMRGLGIEESDSKSSTNSMPTKHQEASKPRGN